MQLTSLLAVLANSSKILSCVILKHKTVPKELLLEESWSDASINVG
jgi:hypothetical protein